METAGLLDLPGRILEQRKKADESVFAEQEEVEVKRVKTFSWRPGKGLEEGVVEKVTSAVEEFEDLKSDCEDWDSGDEDCSVLTDTAFLEVETISHYEEEDWDKELADSENNNPYDFEDVIHCGGMDQDPVASCSVQEEPLYDPSLHHVAPLPLRQLQTVPVDGQFDDAVD